MKLTDDDLAIVRGVFVYAGEEMDPDDQAFYLRHYVLYLDTDGTQLIEGAPTLAELIEAGVVELDEDELSVLTPAAIEAARQS
jgi:hypothetical protein